MNVTVINKKELIKYLVVLITSTIVIVSATRFFYKKSNNISFMNNDFYIGIIENIIPLIGLNKENLSNDINLDINKENILTKIIEHELGILSNSHIVDNQVNIGDAQLKDSDNDPNQNFQNNNDAENKNIIAKVENEDEKIALASTDVKTKVIDENNIIPSYSVEIDGIKVKNQSSYEVTEELINAPLGVENRKDILIFHTHTCESYTSSEKYSYEPTGNFRTTDKNFSVVRVGSELNKYLLAYGFNVVHDTTCHDYPSYTGSYDRSLVTVQGILKKYPDTDIVIDLHRDAVGSSSEYGPSVMIGEEKAAQLMFVIGTDGGGLHHPDWRRNLSLAVTIQKKANEMYPGLFRPIILRDSRYNQHLAVGACIIEVGATGNTLDECLVSMKYLSNVMNEALN